MTVRECIQYYRDNICKSKSAINSYTSIEKKFPVLMNTELEDLKPINVIMAFNEAEGLSENSIHNYYILIKTAIKRTIADHDLKFKIKLDGIIKKSKKTILGVRYLELDDVKKIRSYELTKARKQRARDLFLLMCLSGMAISDAYKFDPEKHIKDGKWFTYNRTKNTNACLIPVLDDAREIIEKYQGQWPLGESIGNLKTFWNHCQWIGDIVGKKISAHTARRTMGCIFLEFGFSLESVSSMLGHRTTATTAKHYAFCTAQKVEREMERIPEGTLTIK